MQFYHLSICRTDNKPYFWGQMDTTISENDYKPKQMRLRNMPEEVYNKLLKVQAEQKLKRKKGQFGLDQTIYLIVRKYESIDSASK